MPGWKRFQTTPSRTRSVKACERKSVVQKGYHRVVDWSSKVKTTYCVKIGLTHILCEAWFDWHFLIGFAKQWPWACLEGWGLCWKNGEASCNRTRTQIATYPWHHKKINKEGLEIWCCCKILQVNYKKLRFFLDSYWKPLGIAIAYAHGMGSFRTWNAKVKLRSYLLNACPHEQARVVCTWDHGRDKR